MIRNLLILLLLVLAVFAAGWIISRVQREEAERTRLVLRWLAALGLLAVLALLFVKLGRAGGGGFFADFFTVLFLVGAIALCSIFLGILWAPQFGSGSLRSHCQFI